MLEYKVHPVAALFPLLEGDQRIQFVADIRAHGQNEPIVLAPDGATIVDGRNRFLACQDIGLEPIFRVLGQRYGELEIIQFIISANLRRRHFDSGQTAVFGLQLELPYAKAVKREKLGSRLRTKTSRIEQQIATMLCVDRSTMVQAKYVRRHAPLLMRRVMSGDLNLKAAYRSARTRRKSEEKEKASRGGDKMILFTHQGEPVDYKSPKGKSTFNTTNDQVSWAPWTWNPVTGCLHGCRYCYAREISSWPKMREHYPAGFTPLFHPERLDAPANTTVPDKLRGQPRWRRVFVCSMADLYGQWVPDEWIEQVHLSCIKNPQWEYLMLTKFPRRYVGLKLPPTAWLGTTVDEQKRVRLAEEAFRQISGVRVKWLSLEPLLAPLEFSDLSMFDWVIIGSQSATDQSETENPEFGVVPEFAPPFEWVARLTLQAKEAGCKVYHKPNLLGRPHAQCAGMRLLQEEPILPVLNVGQQELAFGDERSVSSVTK